MPNPVINPNVWAPGATFTVTQTNELRVDIRLADLGNTPAEIEVDPPAATTIRVLRNPANWTTVGVDVRTGGVWVGMPVALGDWTVTVVPGAPTVLSVSNPNGLSPTGVLRLVVTGLAGTTISIGPGGGDMSIDRLLADPSITNVQVTSATPVRELDEVDLSSTLSAAPVANPAPVIALAPAPPVIGLWAPAGGNAVAVNNFVSAGATASFDAPAVYAALALNFQVTAALDLDSDGTIDPGEPTNVFVLNVPVSTVTHRVVLVLDRSGSMGSGLGGGGTKWEATTKAAHAWIDLFRSLRSGGTHQVGIITFEHADCGWTATPAADIALRNPVNGSQAAALSSLNTFADVTTINLGPVQTCTPIGDALVKAFEVIETGDLTGAKGSIVLLTDGYENAGLTTIAASPPAVGVQTLAARLAAWPGAGVDLVGDRVFTLAVGSSVDEDRLNALAVGTGYYQLTNDLTDILPAFTNMLGEVLDAEQALPVVVGNDPDVPPNSVYFQIPADEQRVVFLVPWANFMDSLRIGWRATGSVASFALVASPSPAVLVSEQRSGHGVVAVDLQVLTGGTVPGTVWRVQHMSGGAAQPLTDADVVAVRDLHTRTIIGLDRRQYFIGDQIRLNCSIRSGGVPVTGASVQVDIAKPGEGLGTFLAVNSGKLGQRPRPDYPSHVKVDPDQGKGLMFKTLLELAEIDDLPVVVPPDLELFDDGAHGDGAAADGDYSNVFAATDKEGTYTFRFRVTGQLPDGSTFSRLFVRSTWVGVRADPVATTVAWQVGSSVDGQVRATLTIRPQTSTGELLGPFRHDVITFTVWNAVLDGPIVDRLDGSYEQRIVYRPGDDPVIVPAVYGEPLLPVGPTMGPGGKPGCLAPWISALRATWRWIKGLFG